MTTRVTNQINSLYNLRNIQRQQANLNTLQRQISSGQRIAKPSDDPLGIRLQLLQQDQVSRLESHQRSIQLAQLQLNQAHDQLTNVHNLFIRAQQIGLQAVQATEATDRSALASELDGIINELNRIANDVSAEGALFGGGALDRLPYVTDTSGNTTYQGANSPTKLILGDSFGQANLVAGSDVFGTPGRGATLIEGTTGITPGTGTDSATGLRELQVVHTATTINGTSGLQSSSVGSPSDTLLGTHQLVINDTSGTGAFGTISFLNGSLHSYTSSDTNLEVVGPGGELIHVDTSAITPGFSGTITVQGDGQLSIDGGLTQAPIQFSANQVVVDSRNGTTVNLNTSTVKKSGTDRVEFQQTADAFQTLKLLRDDLLAAGSVPTATSTSRLQRRLDDLERIQDHLLLQMGDQSVRLENLEHLQTYFQDRSNQTKIDLANSSSTDIATAVIQLQQTTNQYQYALSSVSSLYQISLLDFLR